LKEERKLRDYSFGRRDLPSFWWKKKFHLIFISFDIFLSELFSLLSFEKEMVISNRLLEKDSKDKDKVTI
jgi:hypothetical protein